MTRHLNPFAAIAVVSFLLAAPGRVLGQQGTEPADHAAHHPEAAAAAPAPPAAKGMMESMSSAKLDELLMKMNASEGKAKTNAMAELLTALVNDRHSCEAMMEQKMKTMQDKSGADAPMPAHPEAK